MNPEKQRIAIAEACGWTYVVKDHGRIMGLAPKNIHIENSRPIPDYLNDLSAMHEAMKTCEAFDLSYYAVQLYHIVVPEDDRAPDHFISWSTAGLLIAATAAQRAEAFLKTLSLWEQADESATVKKDKLPTSIKNILSGIEAKHHDGA